MRRLSKKPGTLAITRMVAQGKPSKTMGIIKKPMTKINGIILKDPDNNTERQILGLLDQVLRETEYGKVVIELTITRGKYTNVQIIQHKASYNLN